MSSRPRLSRILRAARRTSGGLIAAGGISSVYFYNTDPSFERSVRFWRRAGPVVGHYFFTRAFYRDEAKKQEQYQVLHQRYAPTARAVIEDLRGMFVKVAQVMSVRPEAVPEEYRKEFRKLQDMAPPARWEPIRAVLERDLGAPLHEVFEAIEETPLGSASIGQAHRANWKGKSVAVKVQYPDAAAMLKADFRCLAILLWLVSSETLPMLIQVWEQFATELDYEAEARNLEDLHAALEAAPEFRTRIAVPEPIPELTNGNVIGMGYLPGPKIEVALRQRLEALGVDLGKQEISEWLAAQQRQSLGEQLDAGNDALPGYQSESTGIPTVKESSWLSWAGRFALRCVGLDAMLWIARRFTDWRTSSETSSLELRDALHLALDVHGYQLFFCPLFNADPHPGNLLMLPDGRVGLIDFGQCRRLSDKEKAGLANLIIAVAKKPSSLEVDEEIAGAFEALGVRTRNNDRQFLSLLPRLMFSRLNADWFRTGNLKEILLRDRFVEVPIQVVMAYRTAILLRGLCLVLQENASVAQVWRPWAERWLHEHPDVLSI